MRDEEDREEKKQKRMSTKFTLYIMILAIGVIIGSFATYYIYPYISDEKAKLETCLASKEIIDLQNQNLIAETESCQADKALSADSVSEDLGENLIDENLFP